MSTEMPSTPPVVGGGQKEVDIRSSASGGGGSTHPSDGKTDWNALRNLSIIVFFDLMGVALIVPLITPICNQLGATPSQIGTFSAICEFC